MDRNWKEKWTSPARQPSQPSTPELHLVPRRPIPESKLVDVPPLRVLLVEDSALLVQRIAELVGDLPGVVIAATAGSEAEALTLLANGDIDAVILDLQLHAGSGFGILRALGRQPSGPQVVVFTNFAIAAYRDTALALGASYFLDKSRDYERLPSVLQAMSETRH
jgi:DNA-binding NarL/FixJ family response regulator